MELTQLIGYHWLARIECAVDELVWGLGSGFVVFVSYVQGEFNHSVEKVGEVPSAAMLADCCTYSVKTRSADAAPLWFNSCTPQSTYLHVAFAIVRRAQTRALVRTVHLEPC